MPRLTEEVMSKAVAFPKENPTKVMEKKLAKWILKRMKGGRRPTLSEISWKGLSIARRVGANEYPPTTSRGFGLIKKVKLLERWQSCLQDERQQRAARELEQKERKYKSRNKKRRSVTSVQDSLSLSNEQLIDWLIEKLRRGERPTLKQISLKGLEIRKLFGGREFIPAAHWGHRFIAKHGLLENWRSCLKKEMVTMSQPVGPSEIKIKVENTNDMEAIPRQDFEILEANIKEMNLKYETLQKDYLQIKQERDTLLDLYKQQEESVNEQDLQISGVGSHDTAMDKAVQYAEIHGNQEAISKFNITAESFYKYLSRGIVKERELETESSDPSGGDEDRNLKQWQTFNVATEEISTIHNKLSDHCNDSVKILQIKSKAPVKEMQLSDADKDQSLLPTSESSNNQSHPTEVSKENVQNRNEKVLDWPTSQETRLSSTENNDENPTVCGDSADKFQITTSADYTHSACDTVEQECENTAATAYASDPPKQGKPIDLNGNSCEESQILRFSSDLTEKECTDLLEEAEYHEKMLHLCKAIYENRKLPSQAPKKPTFIANRLLQRMVGDELPANEVLQAHRLLYCTLDKNIEKKFNIQREEEDTVSEV